MEQADSSHIVNSMEDTQEKGKVQMMLTNIVSGVTVEMTTRYTDDESTEHFMTSGCDNEEDVNIIHSMSSAAIQGDHDSILSDVSVVHINQDGLLADVSTVRTEDDQHDIGVLPIESVIHVDEKESGMSDVIEVENKEKEQVTLDYTNIRKSKNELSLSQKDSSSVTNLPPKNPNSINSAIYRSDDDIYPQEKTESPRKTDSSDGLLLRNIMRDCTSIGNTSLDSLVDMIKSTVDVWRRDNPLQPLSQEKDSLRQDAQLLCDKFANHGEEAFFLTVNLSDSTTCYQGSKKGMGFLDQRSDVMEDFQKFCKEKNDEQLRSRTRMVPSVRSSRKSPKHNTYSKRCATEGNDNAMVDDCNYSDDSCGVTVTDDETKNKPILGGERDAPKVQRKDFRIPNESDMETCDESDIFQKATENYLPRSSRKIKLPSWRQDYGTFLIDYSSGSKSDQSRNNSSDVGTSSERSSIPKFKIEGKFTKLKTDYTGAMTFSCIQCYTTVRSCNLQRHWLKHEEETGSYPCSKCSIILKTLKYQQQHYLIEHEGIKDLTYCNRCKLRFPKGKLIHHFQTEHWVKKETRADGKIKLDNTDLSKSLKGVKKEDKMMKNAEGTVEDWSCHLCDALFHQHRRLELHLYNKHQLKDENQCRVCEKKFTDYRKYVAHYVNAHRQGKETKHKLDSSYCEKCNKKYGRPEYLQYHNNKKHKDNQKETTSLPLMNGKPYCKSCKRQFQRPLNYYQHMKAVHDNTAKSEQFPVSSLNVKKPKLNSDSKKREKSDSENDSDVEENEDEFMNENDQKDDSDFVLKSELTKSKSPQITLKNRTSKNRKNKKKRKISSEKEDLEKCYVKLEDFGDKVDLKMLKCKVCFRMFKSADSLVSHMERHNSPEMLCNICNKNCGTPFRLREHMRHHSDTCRLACKLCDKTYIYKRNVRRHYLRHHKVRFCNICTELIPLGEVDEHSKSCKPKSGIVCKLCHQVFKDETTLQNHMKKHQMSAKKSPQKFRCKICNYGCEQEENLINHVKTHHPERMESRTLLTRRKDKDIWKCKICLKEFPSQNVFALHQASHTGKQLKCHICGCKYSTKQALRNHVASHDPTHFFDCKLCKKRFNRSRSLTVHMFSHRESKDFTCPTCGKSFRMKATLRSHLRVHNKDFCFPCDYCERVFRSSTSLRSHLLTHHPNEEKSKLFKTYTCEICSKQFAVKSIYTEHMMSHSGVKNFKCKKCNACFSVAGKLNYHVQNTHLGVQAFFCKVCKLKFPLRSKFSKHLRSDLHIQACKDANVSLQQFHEDMEKFDNGKEFWNSDLMFDVILSNNSSESAQIPSRMKRRHCLICFKKFASLSELFKHKKNHTHCSICEVTVKNAMIFHKHINRKSHLDKCLSKGIDPEVFRYGLRGPDEPSTLAYNEDEEAALHIESKSTAEEEKVDQSKSNLFDQLLDHQYQNPDGPACAVETIDTLDHHTASDQLIIAEHVPPDSNPIQLIQSNVGPDTPIHVVENVTEEGGMEYVVITIPHDALSDDGTFLLDDPAVSALL